MTARCNSSPSRTSIGITSTPIDVLRPEWPRTGRWEGGDRGIASTAARVTPGAICLSSSSHLIGNSELIAGESGDIAARPRHAGDEAGANRIDDVCDTIGSVLVASSSGRMVENPLVKITSGPVATISTARLRMRPGSPAAQRVSMRTFRPMPQPSSCSPCMNAPWRTDASGSSAASVSSILMRRIRCGCCARAGTGHAAAAPPSSVMNSRRLTRSPRRRGREGSAVFRGPRS